MLVILFMIVIICCFSGSGYGCYRRYYEPRFPRTFIPHHHHHGRVHHMHRGPFHRDHHHHHH